MLLNLSTIVFLSLTALVSLNAHAQSCVKTLNLSNNSCGASGGFNVGSGTCLNGQVKQYSRSICTAAHLVAADIDYQCQISGGCSVTPPPPPPPVVNPPPIALPITYTIKSQILSASSLSSNLVQLYLRDTTLDPLECRYSSNTHSLSLDRSNALNANQLSLFTSSVGKWMQFTLACPKARISNGSFHTYPAGCYVVSAAVIATPFPLQCY